MSKSFVDKSDAEKFRELWEWSQSLEASVQRLAARVRALEKRGREDEAESSPRDQ